jgi:hypothetical protein
LPGPTIRARRSETLAGALDARRHDAAGDDRRLEQAEIVLREIEHLVEAGNLRGAAEVHAGEAQHRLLDHAQAGLDRRGWFPVAAVHGEIDRNVEHFGALGIVHAEEEDITPAAMREVHADRGALAQDGIKSARGIAPKKFRADAQRLVGRVAHAEHPLVAATLRTLRRTWSARVWNASF